MAAPLALAALPARAETLREALVAAYRNNPDLASARATQRATDENVPIARARALPSLQGSVNYAHTLEKQAYGAFDFYPTDTFQATTSFNAPLYAGGGTRSAISAARTRVAEGAATLRSTETSVFSSVVTAYLDVTLDAAIVALNRKNVAVLEINLKATSDRFEIGDVTRTDVAQSNSRLAQGRATLRTSESNLIGARERYIQVVGHAPDQLDPPPPLAGLPHAPDDAVQIALDANPDLIAARLSTKAAGYDIKTADATRLPTVSVVGSTAYTNYLGTLPQSSGLTGSLPHTGSAQIGLQATIPFYQGGLPSAQIRAAQAREGAADEHEISVEREVIATVRADFAAYRSANDAIGLNQTAVAAAALSLEGVRAENTVGNRTILNILDAEQELVNAQVNLETARRNAYVAGFNLLAAMGKAQSRDLALDDELGAALYDPQVHYDHVARDMSDWHRDPEPVRTSTSTRTTPAQDATVPSLPLP
ncbi:TolC family outer membrane protein [Novosphingobium sp.]|uniref:TolC family outer membrane protein n=1 Tax=Novosphingobium sp. TaxID=1874826 RepID=UPI003340E4B9